MTQQQKDFQKKARESRDKQRVKKKRKINDHNRTKGVKIGSFQKSFSIPHLISIYNPTSINSTVANIGILPTN
jgi:hypothetical protein